MAPRKMFEQAPDRPEREPDVYEPGQVHILTPEEAAVEIAKKREEEDEESPDTDAELSETEGLFDESEKPV